jgi:hypothetical protein
MLSFSKIDEKCCDANFFIIFAKGLGILISPLLRDI